MKENSLVHYLCASNYILLNRKTLKRFGVVKAIILCLIPDNYVNKEEYKITIEELQDLGISNRALNIALNELIRDGYLKAIKKNELFQISDELICKLT